jgi:hypothetical protein
VQEALLEYVTQHAGIDPASLAPPGEPPPQQPPPQEQQPQQPLQQQTESEDVARGDSPAPPAAPLGYADPLDAWRPLLAWFGSHFPYNRVLCGACGEQGYVLGAVAPTPRERSFDAGRVELHRCASCGHVSRFPRYNSVAKVLQTRQGRCGEYSTVVLQLALALGWRARWVVDWEDHVWVEIWVPDREISISAGGGGGAAAATRGAAAGDDPAVAGGSDAAQLSGGGAAALCEEAAAEEGAKELEAGGRGDARGRWARVRADGRSTWLWRRRAAAAQAQAEAQAEAEEAVAAAAAVEAAAAAAAADAAVAVLGDGVADERGGREWLWRRRRAQAVGTEELDEAEGAEEAKAALALGAAASEQAADGQGVGGEGEEGEERREGEALPRYRRSIWLSGRALRLWQRQQAAARGQATEAEVGAVGAAEAAEAVGIAAAAVEEAPAAGGAELPQGEEERRRWLWRQRAAPAGAAAEAGALEAAAEAKAEARALEAASEVRWAMEAEAEALEVVGRGGATRSGENTWRQRRPRLWLRRRCANVDALAVEAAASGDACEGGEGREEGGALTGAERGMLRESLAASGDGRARETWRARGWKRHRAAVNGAGRAVLQARGRLARGRLARRRRLGDDQEGQAEAADRDYEEVPAFVEEEDGGRWVHLDPCEAAVDEPRLYASWGKKHTYVVAVGSDGMCDVTAKYATNLTAALERRQLSEAQVARAIRRVRMMSGPKLG